MRLPAVPSIGDLVLFILSAVLIGPGCASLGLVSPVPHTLTVHLVVDGRAMTSEAADADGLVLQLHQRGDRAWVEVRNDGDRTRVIEQVAFEHRFPDGGPVSKVPRPKSTGPVPASEDAGQATPDLGPGTLDLGQRTWDVVIHGPRAFVRGAKAGYSTTIDTPEAFAEAFSGGARFWYTPHYALAPGVAVQGPAIIEQRESTVVVGPKASASLDAQFNLIMLLEGKS